MCTDALQSKVLKVKVTFLYKPIRLQQNTAARTDQRDPHSEVFQGFNPSHTGFSPQKKPCCFASHCLLMLWVFLSVAAPSGRSEEHWDVIPDHSWNFICLSPRDTPVSGGAMRACLCSMAAGA